MEDLSANYKSTPVYTSFFYAEPEQRIKNHSNLMETLQAFVKNQTVDVMFALQIMLTNSEIMIMPLGLNDINELKEYTNKKRAEQNTLISSGTDELPIVVQFDPHVENGKVSKKIVTTMEELFNDFNNAFPKIWDEVSKKIDENQSILEDIENELINDSKSVQPKLMQKISELSMEEREKLSGKKIDDNELTRFSQYLADNNEVKAILSSSASFAQHEIFANDPFDEVMKDNIRKNTFFWDLDNTYYEIYYFYAIKYASNNDALRKRLLHLQQDWMVQMRSNAWEKVKSLADDLDENKFNVGEFFENIFMPVAEQIVAEIRDFSAY
ncbi:MAG: hypothetical protein IAA89_00915 [Firmicutes bacterium]|uniref:Uncharacterized protein n=1 Tax=Candidatus Gallilactobacillus intestinavium TaxID=2840838 RepID=A0A9D9H7I1_9LACO|nr:hypothetical protein [Candidatus Gallilactobacillus intestinavium]